MKQADEALLRGEPDGRPPLGLAQHRGGAPVAGEAAGMGGEQDDERGHRGRVQILLVLDGVAAEHARADDQRRGPVELGSGLRAGGLASGARAPRGRGRGSARGW